MVECYVGEIRMFGFNFAPSQWQLCNGQLLGINQYQALFALIGTYYGGNGTTTFQLPNMQSRVPIHQGQGAGLSPYVIGEYSGVEQASILISNMPQHTHTATFTPSGGGGAAAVSVLSTAATTALTATPAAGSMLANTAPTGLNQPKIYAPSGTTGTPVNLGGVSGGGGGGGTVTNALTGSGVPFNIVQPYLCVSFCIALFGVYPSRN